MEDKKLSYQKTLVVKQNPTYPKVRLLCGEFLRIEKPDSVPEFYYHGRWRAA